jgi:hypothetical protein
VLVASDAVVTGARPSGLKGRQGLAVCPGTCLQRRAESHRRGHSVPEATRAVRLKVKLRMRRGHADGVRGPEVASNITVRALRTRHQSRAVRADDDGQPFTSGTHATKDLPASSAG